MSNNKNLVTIFTFKDQGVAKFSLFKHKLFGNAGDNLIIKRRKEGNISQRLRTEGRGSLVKMDTNSFGFLQLNLCTVDTVGAGSYMYPGKELENPSRGYRHHLWRRLGRIRQISCNMGCYTALQQTAGFLL